MAPSVWDRGPRALLFLEGPPDRGPPCRRAGATPPHHPHAGKRSQQESAVPVSLPDQSKQFLSYLVPLGPRAWPRATSSPHRVPAPKFRTPSTELP